MQYIIKNGNYALLIWVKKNYPKIKAVHTTIIKFGPSIPSYTAFYWDTHFHRLTLNTFLILIELRSCALITGKN